MRRLVATGSAVALLLAASAAAADPGPVTCAESSLDFGVRLDDQALALSEIYVDGVVPVPVRFGLQPGLTRVNDVSELVARGLVQLDVADASGIALAGSVEIVDNWLIWVGESVFESNATYELSYSFANDQISVCPEAIPHSGLIPFSTGQRSAAEDLAAPSLEPSLAVTRFGAPGCCTVRDPQRVVPSSHPCLTTGTCVACWDDVAQISFANAFARTTLPPTYFKMDFSLLADGQPQAITYQRFGHANFSIKDAAAQYCFQTDLKVRGPVNAIASVNQCFSSDSVPELTGLPLDGCAEGSQPLLRRDTRLQANFGATEEEARYRPMHTLGDDVAEGCALDDCAVGSRSGNSSGGWLFALLVLATAARRKLP
jgi:MYXO-CTERM domain-containing protein